MKITLIPHAKSMIYAAGAVIFRDGPMTRQALCNAVNLGTRPDARNHKIRTAIADGWLIEVDGKVDVSNLAKAHFNGEALPEASGKPAVGLRATARFNSAYDRPPLSKQFIPNSRGTRPDVPAFSVRENMRFSTLAGGV